MVRIRLARHGPVFQRIGFSMQAFLQVKNNTYRPWNNYAQIITLEMIMEPIVKKFGKRVRQLRLERGLHKKA
jgi:hypothetical protein